MQFISKYKLSTEWGHRSSAFGDGETSFSWTALVLLGGTRGKLSPQMPALPVELRVSQASLCPLPWALDLHQTAHMGKATGVGAPVRHSSQETLPRLLESIWAGIWACTVSVHTAFLKQLFTHWAWSTGYWDLCLDFPQLWVYASREVCLCVFGSAGNLPGEMLGCDCWKSTWPEQEQCPDCQVWNHWLYSWLCLGSQSQATFWLPDPLGRFLFLISLRYIKIWPNSVLVITCWHYSKCLLPAP